MFRFNEKEDYFKISGIEHEEREFIALNSNSEEEMFELIKTLNPFIIRKIASNNNITKKVALHILENNIAYTMCINLAKNKIVDTEIKDKLYYIATVGHYKDSLMKEDLDKIFKNNKRTI